MPPKPTMWSDGARALARYLVAHNLTMNAFATSVGIDYGQLHRSLSGARGRRTAIDFADNIERGTSGEVPARLWRSDTLSSVKPVATPPHPHHGHTAPEAA